MVWSRKESICEDIGIYLQGSLALQCITMYAKTLWRDCFFFLFTSFFSPILQEGRLFLSLLTFFFFVHICAPYLSLNLFTTDCGICGVFQSLFEFIRRFFGGMFDIEAYGNLSLGCIIVTKNSFFKLALNDPLMHREILFQQSDYHLVLDIIIS